MYGISGKLLFFGRIVWKKLTNHVFVCLGCLFRKNFKSEKSWLIEEAIKTFNDD